MGEKSLFIIIILFKALLAGGDSPVDEHGKRPPELKHVHSV